MIQCTNYVIKEETEHTLIITKIPCIEFYDVFRKDIHNNMIYVYTVVYDATDKKFKKLFSSTKYADLYRFKELNTDLLRDRKAIEFCKYVMNSDTSMISILNLQKMFYELEALYGNRTLELC